MRVRYVLALAIAAAPLTAADAMNVAEFLAKADALEKKGAMALFSSDNRLLKNEVQGAATRLRAERAAAEKAGRRGAYCPRDKTGLTPKEIVAYFRTIPPARRGTEVDDALRTLLARKYPCPA